MKLEIVGFSLQRTEIIKEAVNYAFDFIGVSQTKRKNLVLSIIAGGKEFKRFSRYAETECLDSKHRQFEIVIGNFKNNVLFYKILFHELVHVYQYLTFKMKDLKNGLTRYVNEYHPFDENITEAYWKYPWEIEARGWERGLIITFFHKKGWKDQLMKRSIMYDLI